MRRRDFITLIGSTAAAWPLAAHAQQPGRIRRIGVLIASTENDPDSKARLTNFKGGLEQLGWTEGQNIQIEIRYADSRPDLYERLAKELVGSQPDVIFANTTAVVAAVGRETRTIPVVFVAVSDPIGSGFIESMSRPGGNLTGLSLYEEGITGKWLAMLKEIAPHLVRAALLANPKQTPFDYYLRSAKATAASLGIDVVPAPIANTADIERAIESFAQVPNGGLVVLPTTTFAENPDLLVALAARHRLPAIYPFRYFVVAGGLMAYSTDLVEQSRRAASYVNRILRGDKPADLPVQAPTRYETTVNLRTAKAIGLTVPPGLLVAADEVIE
jgi:putative tryptophan/tyrosine transport system substrate-binding protein